MCREKSNESYAVCGFGHSLPSKSAVPQKRFATTAINEQTLRLSLQIIHRVIFQTLIDRSGYAILSFEVVDHFLEHNLYYPPYTLQSCKLNINQEFGTDFKD